MFHVLSDQSIYEFENEPPESKEWLLNRYNLLQSRSSPDGTEQWLNWVVRLPTGKLAGYVQATVLASGISHVAYELNSSHWRQGIGSSSVLAMIEELRDAYGVHTFLAVFKTANYRSEALLRSLGFSRIAGSQENLVALDPDETAMLMRIDGPRNAT